MRKFRASIITVLFAVISVACATSGLKDESPKNEAPATPTKNDEESAMSANDPENAPESDGDLKDRLTPLQFQVTQESGTERAFTGEYWDTKKDGVYQCVVCGAELFDSDTKYDSGSGWPSFWEPMDGDKIHYKEDKSLMMGTRIEVECGKCGAHLGHVFDDGPQPTGKRYCINSASLALEEEGEESE